VLKKTWTATAMTVTLIATAPVGTAATVLTLEGGLVGMQHIVHFTPGQLGGKLCKAPNHCQPVDYFAFPGGAFTDQGATNVENAIDALPADEQIVLFGHSQGGQVVYTDLRRWAADPDNAPDPARLSWVSIGNPENKYGGTRAKPAEDPNPWLPDDTVYQGTEVIRQYDGWADWPDDPTNLLAVINATIGKLTIHSFYRQVDLDDPANVRYTPDLPDGSPGNVTYVWVPTATVPLAAWAGPLAPTLDNLLRPMIEKGYNRPVEIPDPTPPSAVAEHSTPPTASAQSAPSTVAAAPSTVAAAPSTMAARPATHSTAVTIRSALRSAAVQRSASSPGAHNALHPDHRVATTAAANRPAAAAHNTGHRAESRGESRRARSTGGQGE